MKRAKKPKLANWWPALGPEPKHRERKLIIPDPIVKDAPARPTPTAVIERATINATLADDDKALGLDDRPPKPVKLKKLRKHKRYYARDFYLSHHVASVASLSLDVARNVIIAACPVPKKHARYRPVDTGWNMEPKSITVTLDYPLSRACEITIKPFRLWKGGPDCMDIGYVLWTLAKQYERIYKEHKRYGVWGHMMGDLYFERLTIDKKGRGSLFVGS
jgi:hypothetical protein